MTLKVKVIHIFIFYLNEQNLSDDVTDEWTCGDVIPEQQSNVQYVPNTALWREIAGVVPGIGRIHSSSLGRRLIVSLPCCCHWRPQLLSLPPPLCPPPQCPTCCPSLVCQSVSESPTGTQLGRSPSRSEWCPTLTSEFPTQPWSSHSMQALATWNVHLLPCCYVLESQGLLCIHLETSLGWQILGSTTLALRACLCAAMIEASLLPCPDISYFLSLANIQLVTAGHSGTRNIFSIFLSSAPVTLSPNYMQAGKQAHMETVYVLPGHDQHRTLIQYASEKKRWTFDVLITKGIIFML